MSHFTGQHRLPVDPEVSASDRQAVEELIGEHLRQERVALERTAEEARHVVGPLEQRLHDLIGEDSHARFRHLLWTERMQIMDALQPPSGLSLDLDELNRERKERADSFLRDLGVEPQQLSELAAQGRKELEARRPSSPGRRSRRHLHIGDVRRPLP